MRLAFADLLFSWPPHGGADVDVFQTVIHLRAAGHDVRLFGAKCELSWERGNFEPERLPFPATQILFTPREIRPGIMAQRFRKALDEWQPEAVFLCDGFFLKPYVAEALSPWPVAARYYAYEVACPRDFRLYRNGATCPNNYLRTPDECRRCSLEGVHAEEIKRWSFHSWTQEYMVGRAYMPSYHARLVRSLQQCRTVIVYNHIQKAQLDSFHPDVRVIPGGVNTDEFTPVRETGRARKIILMTGRVEDPTKGLKTLREAGERLAAHRQDFEIHVTHTDYALSNDWFKAIGWHAHEGIKRLYANSDIFVAASTWEEPFGMVAVEAMASGMPVCASRVGGLQEIVVDGETGFLFNPGDSAGLARSLERLLGDPALCSRMGEASRRRAESEYDWRQIVQRHYPPILERLAT